MQPHDGRPEDQREPGSSASPDDAGRSASTPWSTPTRSDNGEPGQGSGGQHTGTPGASGDGGWQNRLNGPADGGGAPSYGGGSAYGDSGHGGQGGPSGQSGQPTQNYGQPSYGASPSYGEPSGSGYGSPAGGSGYGGGAPSYGDQSGQSGQAGQSGQGGQAGQGGQSPYGGGSSYGDQSGGGYGSPAGGGYQPTQQFAAPTYGDQSGSSSGYGASPAYGAEQPWGQSGSGQGGYGQPGDGYGAGGYGQPGYGQPGYGQPGYGGQPGAPTPAKKSHLGRWLGLGGAVVVIAVVAILLFVAPGFVVKKVLDPTAVAQTITSQSQNGNGDYSGVTCPSGEKVEKGNTFACTAADSKSITVTITSNGGDYTWEPAN